MPLPPNTAVRVDLSDIGTEQTRWPTAVVTEPPANACDLSDSAALTWLRYDDGRVHAVPTWRIRPMAEAA